MHAAMKQLEAAERQGIPLLLPGLVASWPACTSWTGTDGLHHMHSLAAQNPGDHPVQVMCGLRSSQCTTVLPAFDQQASHPASCIPQAALLCRYSSSDTFKGDITSLQPATLSMCEFLEEAGRAAAGQPGPNLYLAQQPLMGAGAECVCAAAPCCCPNVQVVGGSASTYICSKQMSELASNLFQIINAR